MSITNEQGETIKGFVRLKIEWTVPNGRNGQREKLEKWTILETAYPHGKNLDVVSLVTRGGAIIQFTAREVEITSDEGEAAFDCLIHTLGPILGLSTTAMTEAERARIGRWLTAKLLEQGPGNVRTIGDLRVADLIDLLSDAQSPCIVI
jgi:hypothetical protein